MKKKKYIIYFIISIMLLGNIVPAKVNAITTVNNQSMEDFKQKQEEYEEEFNQKQEEFQKEFEEDFNKNQEEFEKNFEEIKKKQKGFDSFNFIFIAFIVVFGIVAIAIIVVFFKTFKTVVNSAEKAEKRKEEANSEYKVLKCPSCGAPLNHDSKECEYCGVKLTKVRKTK